MNNITKKELEEYIAEAQELQSIEVEVRKVIEEFKHYKQVNKRFTDRLKELGYHAYTQTSSYPQRICVSKGQHVLQISAYNKPFTWDDMLDEFKKMDHAGNERYWTEKLNNYESDIQKLKDLQAYIKDLKLGCFNPWKFLSDLDSCIRNEVNQH